MGYINPSAKVARHYERLAAWQRGEVFAPVGVEIDLTNRCNLGCKFCHFAYTHSRGHHARKNDPRYLDMGDEMDFALLKRALKEMAGFGVKSVTFTGGGEPTLHPRFADAVVEAKSNGLQVGLYTNGTLIDGVKAQVIKDNCAWVVVSLDEANRENYQRVKQVDAFDKACEGTRKLVGGNAVVGVSFLVGWQRYRGYLQDAQVLGVQLGANYTEFRPRIIFDEDNPSVAAESTEWVKTDLKVWKGWSAILPGTDIRFEQFELYADYHRNYPVCNGILFTGVITPNGKVWKCVNRRGFPDSVIGDLTTESFRDVWAKQKPHTDFAKCRVLCRADVLNRHLAKLAEPLPHGDFV